MLKNVQGSSSLHDALTVLVFSSKARSQFPIPTLPNGNSLCYPFPMLVIQQYVVPKTLVKCDCVWVLTLVCPSSVIVRIVEDILPRIEDTQNEKDKCTIRLLVHQSHAGALIGRQGGKIKELRDRTNARIKVFQQCCPQSTDRICMLSGDDRNVIDAVEQIVEELKQIPIKGPVNPYTSFNYDPTMAPDYGGFSPAFPTSGRGGPPISPFSGGPRRSLGAPLPPMRGGGGLGGPDMRYDRGLGRDYDSGPYGGPMGGPPPYGGGGGLYGGYPGQNSIQTTQVTIPSDLGGTIIGRGGDRINRIRDESGAQIQLEPSSGQEERVITITGTQTQIHAAQYLLQQWSVQIGFKL
ncbi:hypothetical protein Y032_0053g2300 [Ancylostoma ceylanicum]|uniref:K Homology domain-containing protein n=1 Tax=Ancylostoma ceylanicum TaxID=53326 RepID=A0A016U7G5_9BILA|nr:hypothetical protein Y032_0053g2300 [Ancylostoma ceylanicum]